MSTLDENILTKIDLEIETGLFNETLMNAFNESNKKEFVIINIGTDRVTGDCLGPLLGTLLEEKELSNIKIYGTLKDPIHAKNLEYKILEIYKAHPDAFFLAIDACLAQDYEHLDKIYLRSIPIQPGKGLGKDLLSVGDYSIIANVAMADEFNFFELNRVRLNIVWNLANKLKKEIIELNSLLEKEELEYAAV